MRRDTRRKRRPPQCLSEGPGVRLQTPSERAEWTRWAQAGDGLTISDGAAPW